MFKYQTNNYRIEIEKVEIIKETDKTIWIKKKNSNGKEFCRIFRRNTLKFWG